MEASGVEVKRVVPTFVWKPNDASYYRGRCPFCKKWFHLDDITFLGRKCSHFVKIEGDEAIFSNLAAEVAV